MPYRLPPLLQPLGLRASATQMQNSTGAGRGRPQKASDPSSSIANHNAPHAPIANANSNMQGSTAMSNTSMPSSNASIAKQSNINMRPKKANASMGFPMMGSNAMNMPMPAKMPDMGLSAMGSSGAMSAGMDGMGGGMGMGSGAMDFGSAMGKMARLRRN